MNRSNIPVVIALLAGLLLMLSPAFVIAKDTGFEKSFMRGFPAVLGHFYGHILLFAIGLFVLRLVYSVVGNPAALTKLSREAANGNLARVMDLIQDGADVNQADKKGMTALMLAVRNDHLATSRYLIERGADAKAETKKGQSVLDVAKKHASPEVVDLIRSAGKPKMIDN